MFFRIVISPDPQKEDKGRDLYLWQITEQTMLKLEDRVERLLQWVATEHSDHATQTHPSSCSSPKKTHLRRPASPPYGSNQSSSLPAPGARPGIAAKLQQTEEVQWAY